MFNATQDDDTENNEINDAIYRDTFALVHIQSDDM